MKPQEVLQVLHDNHVTPSDLMQLVCPGVQQLLENLTQDDLELDAAIALIDLTKTDTINDLDWGYKLNDIYEAVQAVKKALK